MLSKNFEFSNFRISLFEFSKKKTFGKLEINGSYWRAGWRLKSLTVWKKVLEEGGGTKTGGWGVGGLGPNVFEFFLMVLNTHPSLPSSGFELVDFSVLCGNSTFDIFTHFLTSFWLKKVSDTQKWHYLKKLKILEKTFL